MSTSLHVAPGISGRIGCYEPNGHLPMHQHGTAVVAAVRSDLVTERSSGQTVRRVVGAVRILPAGLAHENSYGPRGARSVIIEVDAAASSLSRGALATLDRPADLDRLSPASMIVRQIEVELHAVDELSPLSVDGLLRQLLAVLGRTPLAPTPSSAPGWIARVEELLRDDLSRTPTLADLASVAGVHPAHVSRSFRRHLGKTPAEYLLATRIEWARVELARTQRAISDIAHAAGFADHAHFSRRFKRAMGMTPAQYRAARRV